MHTTLIWNVQKPVACIEAAFSCTARFLCICFCCYKGVDMNGQLSWECMLLYHHHSFRALLWSTLHNSQLLEASLLGKSPYGTKTRWRLQGKYLILEQLYDDNSAKSEFRPLVSTYGTIWDTALTNKITDIGRQRC